MIAGISRVIMTLAAACLGDHQREWAAAMQAELEAADEDGRSLAFSLGCLMAALRLLPEHREGRLAIASHVFAFVIAIPVAALLVSSILVDFPYSYLQPIGRQTPLLSDGNRSAVPSLAALVTLLAISHLRLAWLVLERDWTRTAAMGMLIAAITVTLTILTSVVFADFARGAAQAAALAIEIAGIWALACWHACSVRGSPGHLG